jgi:hypothetical protein
MMHYRAIWKRLLHIRCIKWFLPQTEHKWITPHSRQWWFIKTKVWIKYYPNLIFLVRNKCVYAQGLCLIEKIYYSPWAFPLIFSLIKLRFLLSSGCYGLPTNSTFVVDKFKWEIYKYLNLIMKLCYFKYLKKERERNTKLRVFPKEMIMTFDLQLCSFNGLNMIIISISNTFSNYYLYLLYIVFNMYVIISWFFIYIFFAGKIIYY